MKPRLILFIIVLFCISFCTPRKQTKQLSEIKKEHLKNLIKKSGFIKLPLSFDAISNGYSGCSCEINHKGSDSLIFDKDIFEICGFLPDTSNYYSFLFNGACDMACPTIITLDKNGNKIDRKIIVVGTGCYGSPIDAKSCYDSVWIYNDLTIKSESRVVGTIINPSTNKEEDICNMEKLEGYIDRTGKIYIKKSGIILCDDK